MKVTQKQIAQKLNIAQSQVARALRGDPVVAESTRRLVEETAREMGYDLNDNREARALIARRYGQKLKFGVIAVLISPTPGASLRTMPFFIPVLEGMEQEAARQGKDLCLCLTRADELPRLVRDRSIDGVIAMGYFPEYVTSIRALGLPVVTYHNEWDMASSIRPDDREGGRLVTQHLLELGHRRIAFLGVEHVAGQPCALRLEGYRAAMREYGAPLEEDWIAADLPAPFTSCPGCAGCAGCRGWTSLLRQSGYLPTDRSLPFTALVCNNDLLAMDTIQRARQDGFQIPHDLSVTGFDDISLDHHFNPPLTSIDYPRYDMGQRAVRLLCEAIDDENQDATDTAYKHLTLPVTLAVRQSTVQPLYNDNSENPRRRAHSLAGTP